MVEASRTAAAGTTTHRFTASKPHRAYGDGERSVGRPANPRQLLKLGFMVSERTVSRYLPDRRTRRSQTWRTFLANHVGNLAFTSTVTSSFATSDDDVNASVWPCRPVRPSCAVRSVSTQWAVVDWPPSVGRCVAQGQLPPHTHTFQIG